MKCPFVFFLFLLPGIAFAQSKADYEHAIDKYMKFYNQEKIDSIYKLLSNDWKDEKATLYNKDIMDRLKKEMGNIVSYKFIVKDTVYKDDYERPVAFFKIVYSKAANGRNTHAMSISLDENKKIYAFNFLTSSPHIDSLISK